MSSVKRRKYKDGHGWFDSAAVMLDGNVLGLKSTDHWLLTGGDYDASFDRLTQLLQS